MKGMLCGSGCQTTLVYMAEQPSSKTCRPRCRFFLEQRTIMQQTLLLRNPCKRALRTMNAPVGPAPKMTACGCAGGGKPSSSMSSGRLSLRSSPVAWVPCSACLAD